MGALLDVKNLSMSAAYECSAGAGASKHPPQKSANSH